MTGPSADPAEPVDGPTQGSVDPIAVLAAAELDQDLVDSADGRLTRWLGRVRWAVRLLAAVVLLTGVLAVIVAVAAWRGSPVILVVAVLACLPTVIAPVMVARRTGAMADAAAHPRDTVSQARDLLGRVQHAPEIRELSSLVSAIRRRSSAASLAAAAPKLGRIRSTLRVGRLASSLIGRAEPDPRQHRLLVPFTPEKLGTTWSAIWWSWVGWLLAIVVLVISAVGLVA